MKNTVRAHQNGATKRTAEQAQTPSRFQPSATAKILNHPFISADVERRALDALQQMEFNGKAACALLVLQAEALRPCAKHSAGYESLDIPSFDAGIVNLAGIVTCNFEHSIHNFAAELHWMLGKESKPIIEEKSWIFEDSVSALRHCLGLIGHIASDKHCQDFQIDHTTADLLEERLRNSYDRLWEAFVAVRLEFNRQMAA